MFTQWQRKQHQKMIYILVQILTTVWAVNSQQQQQLQVTEVPNVSGTNLRNSGYEYQYVEDWPKLSRKLGSVSAVAFDLRGNVVVFHRGSHVWNISSFDQKNRYTYVETGPINESTLLSFESAGGDLLNEWGANFFYMPHGLTIDKSNNYWLTDVALHQVFKFDLSVSSSEPVLTLGERFEPGTGSSSFCKPTSVAVLDNGDFFVADGYCNGRIMKFSSDGQLILNWGKNSFVLTRTFILPPGPVPENFLAIPHALTYLEDRELICVADREQGRIQCFHGQNGTFHSMYSNTQIGSRLFSIKYLPLDGGLFFMINGPQFTTSEPINGLIMSMNNSEIVGRFYPDTNPQNAFNNPHELAVSADGGQIYVAELLPTKVHKFKRKGQVPKVIKSLEHYRFPPSPPMVADTLYASSLTIVSIVASLLGTSCLILCVSRTMCFKSGGGSGRRSRFSTASENIALHRMGREDEERGEAQ
ncbi:peptidyl-alpha-hydroxyglycine alpha-amidating lyase 1 isoform X2 [Ochlerotatus camptorhynchus]|uniref:peptidyl-alpha-hydroxyglycine alpha-amidating lyase 1 isoform X2 n=1 Tax=Ochlerotatus camptorhynchus TaxID=644619 RepID=UPI0031D596A8